MSGLATNAALRAKQLEGEIAALEERIAIAHPGVRQSLTSELAGKRYALQLLREEFPSETETKP